MSEQTHVERGSDDERLLALLRKLPTGLAISVLKLSLRIDNLVEERDRLRAAIEADRADMPGEGYEERWAIPGKTCGRDSWADVGTLTDTGKRHGVVRIFVPVRPDSEGGE